MRDELMKEVERHFRPEFLNRVDEIVTFRQLTREDLTKVIDIEILGLEKRLQEKQVQLILSPEAKSFIIDEGFNPMYGARPLKRAIQRILEDPLAEEVLRGHFPERTKVLVQVIDGHIHFEASREDPPALPAGAAAAKDDSGDDSGRDDGGDGGDSDGGNGDDKGGGGGDEPVSAADAKPKTGSEGTPSSEG